MFGNFRIDWNNFKTFKRDWWKEYVSIENCPIIQSMSAYEPRKKHMSKTKSNEYKYPCVHSTAKNGIRYVYSNCNDRGHFGISKVIFGDSGFETAIIDLKGEFGMTHHSMAIEIKDLQEGEHILKALQSKKFNNLKNSCLFSSYAIDWNIFKTFKRDWWKEYINEDINILTEEATTEINTTNKMDSMNERSFIKMTIPKLKKYIKDNKLKIKLGQKKKELVKAIIEYKK